MPAELFTRYKFFKEHAGYSTPPGRAACALELARAELRLDADDRVDVTTEPDYDVDLSWDDAEPFNGYNRKRLESGEFVSEGFILTVDEKPVGPSLWGVIYKPGDGYDRVIAAELASEFYAERDAWMAAHVGAAYGI